MIAARVEFPVSKVDLMKELAWRTIDIGKDTSIHPDLVLRDLPEGTFSSLNDVLGKVSGKLITAPNALPLV